MPKSSLNSVKIKSVPRDELIAALRAWAARLKNKHPEVDRVGLFGSYARGDYTPASDADVLIVVSQTDQASPFGRASKYHPQSIPVGCEIIVYTEDELARRQSQNDPWIRQILGEVIWLD